MGSYIIMTFGSLQQRVGDYIKSCNKDLSTYLVKEFSVFIDWKGNSYDSLLVIVKRLTKMVLYKPVKVTINAPDFAEVILDVVKCHRNLPNSVVTGSDALPLPRNLSLLCYLLCIRRSPSTTRKNGPTERPISTMGAHSWILVNLESLSISS